MCIYEYILIYVYIHMYVRAQLCFFSTRTTICAVLLPTCFGEHSAVLLPTTEGCDHLCTWRRYSSQWKDVSINLMYYFSLPKGATTSVHSRSTRDVKPQWPQLNQQDVITAVCFSLGVWITTRAWTATLPVDAILRTTQQTSHKTVLAFIQATC